MTSVAARVGLIRHGRTDWNRARRIQGQCDVPLDEEGLAQAERLAALALPCSPVALYTSDLLRARQTAAVLAARTGLTPQPCRTLRERHFGLLQGLDADEAQVRQPEFWQRHKQRDPYCGFGPGESLTLFMQRVERTLRALARRHAGDALLIVTHAGVIEMADRLARNEPLQTPRRMPIAHCQPYWFIVGDDFRQQD